MSQDGIGPHWTKVWPIRLRHRVADLDIQVSAAEGCAGLWPGVAEGDVVHFGSRLCFRPKADMV